MPSCLTPFSVTMKKHPFIIEIPCGKCPNCADRRLAGWAFRLEQEYKIAHSANFLTLTYADKHQPYDCLGYPTIVKKDVQQFMKNLRKLHPKNHRTIKYYTVGEYGGLSSRPHYHIIMFNHDITKIQSAWQMGNIHYGTVTPCSIIYSLKYMTKSKTVPAWDGDERLPEFSLFSKGLGKSYLTPQMITWHKNDLDNRMYLNIPGNKKIAMPRYYKQKMYNEEERKSISRATQAKLSDDLGRTLSDDEFHSQQVAILAAFKKRQNQLKKNLV
jgi:hypothetical protein